MSTQAFALEEHQAIRESVENKLRSFLNEKVARMAPGEARRAAQQLRDFVLRGGKRMRPLFCYWGWRGAGGRDAGEIFPVAAAVELFHVAALIHDDIIDQSDLRRGKPTMHRLFTQVHGEARWRGDSRHFGVSAALLAGDASLVWSEELFHDGWRAGRSAAAMAVFAQLRADAVHGEYLDLFGEARWGSIADALEVIRHKTARYTVRDPLQLGARVAGATEDLIASYGTFGLLVGEAYQLRDDLFGFFGDPRTTGKSNLDDIRHGKMTVLMAIARDLAGPLEAERIASLYGAAWIGDKEAAELREIVESSGARAVVEEMIHERREGALRELEIADIQSDARAALRQLACAAVDRSV